MLGIAIEQKTRFSVGRQQ